MGSLSRGSRLGDDVSGVGARLGERVRRGLREDVVRVSGGLGEGMCGVARWLREDMGSGLGERVVCDRGPGMGGMRLRRVVRMRSRLGEDMRGNGGSGVGQSGVIRSLRRRMGVGGRAARRARINACGRALDEEAS